MQKNKLIWWIVAAAAAVGIIWIVATKRGEQPTEGVNAPVVPTVNSALQGEVTIGAVLPLTNRAGNLGPAVSQGLAMQKAMQFAAEQINAGVGIGGKKMVIAFEDGTCDETAARAAAEKLINTVGVKLMLGGACDAEAAGMLGLANQKKVVVISPTSRAAHLAKPGDFLFRLAPSDARVGTAAAHYALTDIKAKRAAVLSETGDVLQPLRTAFTDAFKKSGAVIVDDGFAPGSTDFAAWIDKVKSARVDVVFIAAANETSGVAAFKALKDAGITAPLLTTSFLLNDQVVAGDAATLEGAIGFDPAPFHATSERAADFVRAYKARYLEDVPDAFALANAHAAVYLAKDLIEAGKGDGATMQKILSSLTGWSGGALGDVTLDKNGDIAWQRYTMSEAKSGRVVTEIYTLR